MDGRREAILTIILLLATAFVFSGFDSEVTGMQGLNAQNKDNNNLMQEDEKLCECPIASPLASDCSPNTCSGNVCLEFIHSKKEGTPGKLKAHKCVKEGGNNKRESCSCPEDIVNIPPKPLDRGGTIETVVGCELGESLFCANQKCMVTTITTDKNGGVTQKTNPSGNCVGTKI